MYRGHGHVWGMETKIEIRSEMENSKQLALAVPNTVLST